MKYAIHTGRVYVSGVDKEGKPVTCAGLDKAKIFKVKIFAERWIEKHNLTGMKLIKVG